MSREAVYHFEYASDAVIQIVYYAKGLYIVKHNVQNMLFDQVSRGIKNVNTGELAGCDRMFSAVGKQTLTAVECVVRAWQYYDGDQY